MINPWRVNRLINNVKFGIIFQPVSSFLTLVNNVVIHDKRDHFCPAVCRFQVLQQADKQRRIFAAAAHGAHFSCATVQRACQIICFILPRGDHPFLPPSDLPVRTHFGIKMDIHLIFVKHRMLNAAFIQSLADGRHFFILLWIAYMQDMGCSVPHQPRRR